MTNSLENPPADAELRRLAKPVICYRSDQLPPYDAKLYSKARSSMELVQEVTIAPRDANVFEVPAGSVFRIVCTEGHQVGDLNLWNTNDLSERFFSGKTRQLHASHVSTGHRLWSSMPHLRPMATIIADSLSWYGFDQDGASVHDVIGTRCDPYTNHVLNGVDYNKCCHSNLTRALAAYKDLSLSEAENYVHDVVNVFMCTGFTLDTHQYFMKATPARSGDYIEFFAEIDLLGGLSACPGGNCGSTHSDNITPCYPLQVQVFKPADDALSDWSKAQPNGYAGNHGVTASQERKYTESLAKQSG